MSIILFLDCNLLASDLRVILEFHWFQVLNSFVNILFNIFQFRMTVASVEIWKYKNIKYEEDINKTLIMSNYLYLNMKYDVNIFSPVKALSFWKILQGLQHAALHIRRLYCKCFSVNFAIFFRAFKQSWVTGSGRSHLFILLIHIGSPKIM